MPNIALILDKKALLRFNRSKNENAGRYVYAASRWLSVDPAMGDYIPSAPISDEARRRNGNLPGMGGVFNYVNLHAYHYAGNNPVKYVDPDGNLFVAVRLLLNAFFGHGNVKDYSSSLDFQYTFKHSPAMKAEIAKNLVNFKASSAMQKTHTYSGWGDVNFYNHDFSASDIAGYISDMDLHYGVGAVKEYSMTITKKNRTKGILFWKREVTEYTVTITIKDRYDFIKRGGESISDKINDWGYKKQEEGKIKPYDWSFTYEQKIKE
jgi:hypothetical protein